MKRPVVMILLAGALTLSMIAPSALPAVAGNVSVVQAAEKSGIPRRQRRPMTQQ